MTKVNANGQLEWTFEDLDLFAEHILVYKESNRLSDLASSINKKALELGNRNNRFVLSPAWKEMREESNRLYFESRKLYEVSQLIYALWIRGDD